MNVKIPTKFCNSNKRNVVQIKGWEVLMQGVRIRKDGMSKRSGQNSENDCWHPNATGMAKIYRYKHNRRM